MAVDHQGHQVHLYGGGHGPSSESGWYGCSDLWQLRGGNWHPAVEISGPFGRVLPLLVWDEARQRLVLVGGSGQLNQTSSTANRLKTWEFDGEAWIDRGAIGGPVTPGPVAGDFDPGRGCTWALSSNRLWQYDGAAWQEHLNPGGGVPWPNLGRPLAAFDRAAGVFRAINTQPGGPLWTWNGAQWQSHAGSTVDAVGLSYDATLGRVIATVRAAGGQIQFQGWDGAGWVIEPTLPPIVVSGATSSIIAKTYRDEQGRPAVILTGNGVTFPQSLVNGGESLVVSAAVANGQWVARTIPATPRARFKPALAFSPPQGGVVMVGGTTQFDSAAAALDDAWLLRGNRWKQMPVGGLPRDYGVPMFFSRQTQLLTAIGASAGGQTTLHELMPQGWITRQFPGTAVGRDRVAVWDSARGYAVIAGYSPTGPLAYCDALSVGSIALTPNLLNVSTASQVYDEGRQKIVVAGNSGSQTVYQINGTALSSFQSTGGYSTNNPLLAYDPSRGGVVAFGGFSWSAGGDGFPVRTALLGSSSTAWATLPVSLPVGFKFTTAAWDEDARRIVAFGGLLPSNAASGMTVRLSHGPAEIGVQPVAESVLALGQDTLIEAVARGGGVIRYQWLKDGEPLEESDRLRGVDTDALQIVGMTADDAGLYRLRVTNRCGVATSSDARITVINPACAADIGRAGGLAGPDLQLDNNDFIVFIGLFFDGDAFADIGAAGGVDQADGQFDNNDFIVFINRFFSACP